MVTIKAQSSPKNAVRYFSEHLSHGDYYSDQTQVPGLWFGEGCFNVGLMPDTKVAKGEFAALCDGVTPGEGKRLTQSRKANRRCLYDLTVSVPKSVSIMALLGGDSRLLDAHEKAVKATLNEAERMAATRVRRGNAVDTNSSRTTGNIIAARFTHQESRALDPQVHSHCVIFNVTLDQQEQRFKALEPRPIYDNARRLTEVYRSHLERSIRALGYRTYRDRFKAVQIAGIKPELLTRFSKRSIERDKLTALYQTESEKPLTNNQVSTLLHRNRSKKQRHISPISVRKAQLKQLTPQEFSELRQLRMEADDRVFRGVHSVIPILVVQPKWLTVVRLVYLAARPLQVDPFLFTQHNSKQMATFRSLQLLRLSRRTSAFMRFAQKQTALTR